MAEFVQRISLCATSTQPGFWLGHWFSHIVHCHFQIWSTLQTGIAHHHILRLEQCEIVVCNNDCPPLGEHHSKYPRVVVQMRLSTASVLLRTCLAMLFLQHVRLPFSKDPRFPY